MQARVFRKEFTALGGRIAAEETFVDPAHISAAQLQRIRRAQPDVLLLPNYAENEKILGEKIRDAGIKAVFLGPDSWSRKSLRNVPSFDGSFMTTNWSRDLNTPKNRAFITAYSERFHEEPSETAALTYDAFSLLFAAIQVEGKFDPQSIQRGLYALPVFAGVGGDIDFTDSGDPKKGLIVLQFRSGRDTFYTTLYPEGQ
jgi:branched-chain amino acid transport system substrate-binding protein